MATTGCFGGWKDGGFRWPIWTDPLRRPTVRTLLQLSGLEGLDEPERRARGIALVYESRINRSDQGGYGSFSPAAVR